jgi:hypothetical protein
LNVLDISDPSNISLVRTVVVTGDPDFDIVLDSTEQYLYFTENVGASTNLIVVDISDPDKAFLAKTFSLMVTPGPLTSRVYKRSPFESVSGPLRGDALLAANPTYIRINSSSSYLYISDGVGGNLYTVDISTPTNPSITNNFSLGSAVPDLILDSNDAFLYISFGTSVIIFNLADPATPRIAGNVAGFGSPPDLAIGSTNSILYVIDIAPVASPETLVDSSALANPAIIVLDISDPFNPSEITRISSTAPSLFMSLVDLNGAYTYVTSPDGSVLVIFNPTLPAINSLTCSTKVVNVPPKDRINVLKWGPADLQNGVSIIKRNGAQIGSVLQNALTFEDSGRPKGSVDTYTVQGVNLLGQTTPVATCTVEVVD